MSKEFFETMERIEQHAKRIKFLEGTHPELYSKYNIKVMDIESRVLKLEEKIGNDLKKKSKKVSRGK
jgi:hypothetical protein